MDINHYTDQEIVKAILRRDASVTKEYLYRKCYPLFKSIHAKYYTDCETLKTPALSMKRMCGKCIV